jgi:hypothetical protein
MKRIVLLIVLAVSLLGVKSVSGQHYVGVRGGFGGGMSRFEPVLDDRFFSGLTSWGVSWKYRSDVKYVGVIQLDVLYAGQGFQRAENQFADTSYRRTVNSIMMPFMWHPHFQMFKGRSEFFLNLGVYACYNLNSSYEWVSDRNGVFESGDYEMIDIRDNRFGYGLVAGAGLGVNWGRFELVVEARYWFGYSDILKNHTKYEGNPMRSPMDQLNLSVGLYYRLGKYNDKNNGTTRINKTTKGRKSAEKRH